MYVPEIIEVKETLDNAKKDGLIDSWELPYENILTRRSAAIFFVTPKGGSQEEIWNRLRKFDEFSFRPNSEARLSTLQYRVTFSKAEKEKNDNLK